MFKKTFIGLGLSLFLSCQLPLMAMADEVTAVVYGSFNSKSTAQVVQKKLESRLDESIRVTEVIVQGKTYYRLHSEPSADISGTRIKLQEARANHAPEAWIIKFSAPIATPRTTSEKEVTSTPARSVGQKKPLPSDKERVVMEAKAASGEVLRLKRIAPDVAVIRIDGRLDEGVWNTLPAYDELVVIEPDTLAKTPHKTLARLFYNDEGLYVGVDMEQPADTLIRRLSGRDSRHINRDGVSITIDTSGEGRYGYWFGVNLGDSLLDGTVLPERQFSSDWDGAWRGASQKTKKGWSAEFFIPWGTVSMPASGEKRKLGFYMSRKVAYVDERWGWPALPSTAAQFMSALQPLELYGVDPKQQYSFYPFAAIVRDRIDSETRYRLGADMFWRPSTNFQLTATLNPDFGNVESDDVVINLSATETFFPEKRLFFLEGQQVFVASPRANTRRGGVGRSGAPTTLINTRRIGGKPREPVLPVGATVSERELIQPIDLQGAIKGTGQSGKWRYGFLAAFEDDAKFDAILPGGDINLYQDGSDYGVARIFYEDSPGGSYRAFGILSTAVLHPEKDAKVNGLDGHYRSSDGKIKLDGQVFSSDIEGTKTGVGGFVDLDYTIRKGVFQRVGIEYQDEYVDINDLGYLQRNDNLRIRTAHGRSASNLSWARNNEFDIRGFVQRNAEHLFTGGSIFLSNHTTFKNLSSVLVRASFFAESYDDLNSFGNGPFRIEEKSDLLIKYNSDSSQKISYGAGVHYYEEDLGGDSYMGHFDLNWRPTDQFNFSLKLTYKDRNGWLLHQENANMTAFQAEQWQPKLGVDYFISARQQLKLSFQWVGIKAEEDKFYLIDPVPGDLITTTKPAGPSDSFSFSQLSMQIRYRWEIAPLSDIFVVYTRAADKSAALGTSDFSEVFDNAYHEPIGDSLVFKIRYRIGS